MPDETSAVLDWRDWDWRPLARLVAWLLLAAAWSWRCHALSVALLEHALRELVLGWLLSFGLLTYLQALVATGLWRLALVLDDAAYGLAERLVSPFTRRASFAAAFAAAFGVELALILTAIRLAAGAAR